MIHRSGTLDGVGGYAAAGRYSGGGFSAGASQWWVDRFSGSSAPYANVSYPILPYLCRALQWLFSPEGNASSLGFKGFKDKVVADVGTNDGRYVPVFMNLGAADVWGIDPLHETLQGAVNKGLLKPERALAKTLESSVADLAGKIDVATVFNSQLDRDFDVVAKSLWDVVVPGGQLVFTFAERIRRDRTLPALASHFEGSSVSLSGNSIDRPHEFLYVGTRKANPS